MRGGRRAELSRDSSHDITYSHIGEDLRPLGLIGFCRGTALNINDMHTFLAHFQGRAILDQGDRFLHISCLLLNLKG